MSWVNNVLGEQVVTGQAADRDQPLPFGGGITPWTIPSHVPGDHRDRPATPGTAWLPTLSS